MACIPMVIPLLRGLLIQPQGDADAASSEFDGTRG